MGTIALSRQLTSRYSASGSVGVSSSAAQIHRCSRVPMVDYIDLYLIHSPLSGKQRRLETWRALLDLQKAGKLRTVGVSN